MKTLTLIVLLMIFFSNCRKRCVEANYNFEIAAYFQPQDETVNVGDTLWITSESSAIMKDTNTNQLIDFSGATNLGTALGIGELLFTSDSIRGAVDAFDYITLAGDFYTDKDASPSKVKQVRYWEQNGNYLFKIGLIPKMKGIHSVSLADATNTIRKDETKCERTDIKITYGNENKHLDYLEEIYYKGEPIAAIDSTHVYCFKVD